MARIIVADDSEDICRLLKRALEKDGHSVTVMYDTRRWTKSSAARRN